MIKKRVVTLFETYYKNTQIPCQRSPGIARACPITSSVEFFFAIHPPTRGLDTSHEGLVGSKGDDKEQIEYDSTVALCRRKATDDHRSRPGEYEWSSRTRTAADISLLRRNLQERDDDGVAKDHTQLENSRFDRACPCSGFEGNHRDTYKYIIIRYHSDEIP